MNQIDPFRLWGTGLHGDNKVSPAKERSLGEYLAYEAQCRRCRIHGGVAHSGLGQANKILARRCHV